VEAVALCFVDNAGVGRVMSVPIGRFEHAVRFGVGMSSVFSVFLVNDDITSSPGFEGPSGDFRLMPDPEATVALGPMPGWAFAPVDVAEQDGQSFVACPRTFLRSQVERLDGKGLSLRCASEIEFFLGRRAELPPGLGDEPDPAPGHRGPGYSPQVLTRYAGFSTELLRSLQAAGIEVHKYHPEYSIGQFEVSFRPQEPVTAADTVLIAKQLIRAAAHNHGVEPSFAPVVFPGFVGNGAHVHYSLWDRHGANLFEGGRGPEGMRRAAERFSAGILAELPALVAITCPSVASYLRLRPHHWAGAYTCWGRENREAALRFVTGMVGDRPAAANMELKPVDGAGNPYLVLGALIAAGLSGIDRRLALPEPITDDPSALSAARRRRIGVRQLPSSLGEAARELRSSRVLRDAMGDPLFEAFLATREGEVALYEGKSDEEIARAHRWRY
jgi:glutamine synthetase